MKTTLPNTGVVIWSAGTDTVTRTDFNNAFQNVEDRIPVIITGSRPSASRARRIHYDVVTGSFSYDTGSAWVSIGASSTDSVSTASAPGKVASVTKGAAGQTANLSEWRSSSNGLLAFIGVNGSASFRENVLGGNDGGSVISPSSATRKGQIIKGFSGQSANLSEWQGSGGDILASVSVDGSLSSTGGGSFDKTLKVLGVSTLGVVNSTGDGNFTGTQSFKYNNSSTNDSARFLNAGGTLVFRVTKDGGVAGSSLSVGEVLPAASSAPSAAIHARGAAPANPVVRLVGASGQTANIVEANIDGGAPIFTVDKDGALFSASAVRSYGAGTFQGGIYNTPTPLSIGGRVPSMEIITGTEAEGFSDEVVLRHSSISQNPAKRQSRISFKFGDEDTTRTKNMAGIGAVAAAGMGLNPNLTGWQQDSVVFNFDNEGRFYLYGGQDIAGSLKFSSAANQDNIFLTPKNIIGNAGTSGIYMRTEGDLKVSSMDGTQLFRVAGVTGNAYVSGEIQSPSFVLSGGKSLFETTTSGATLASYTTTGRTGFDVLAINHKSGASGGHIHLNNSSGTTSAYGRTDFKGDVLIGGKKFSIQSSAPLFPSTGDVWIQV